MLEDITGAEARHIAKLPKSDGLKLLARRLKLSYDDLDEDLRGASFLDYHYSVLHFCAERGMPWKEVASGLMFANTFFQHLVEDSLPQAISALHNLSVMYVDLGRLGMQSAKKLIQYFTTSVLCHHKLFQFVFKEERMTDLTEMNLTVETHANDVPLKNAEVSTHWEYKHHVKNVTKEEKKRILELNKKKDAIMVKTLNIAQETEDKMSEKECDKNIEVPAAGKFLSSLVENQLDLLHNDVELDIQNMKDVAEIAVAMKAIPIPSDLQTQQILASGGNNKEIPKSARSQSSRKKTPKN